MRHRLVLLRSLTSASLKMYFRNTTALFFTLFIPLVLVVVFGLLSKSNGSGSIKITLTDYANTKLSRSYVDAVSKVSAFKVEKTNDEIHARDELGKGKVDLVVIIPKKFGDFKAGRPEPAVVRTYYNQGKPGNGQTGSLILGQITSGFNSQTTRSPTVYSLKSEGVKTNNLGFIDYILPGIMAMSIMQLGVFSVAFAFISYKTTGALRRIQATPIKPGDFLIAQSITRYIVGIMQIGLLLVIGVWLFGLHVIGSPLNLLAIVTLGITVFLAMGFVVAGMAKDENQAAPVANVIMFPQLFLSGIFFPRESFPHWLNSATGYLPLTYLGDSMRAIFNQGVSLWAVRWDILGLLVWGAIAYYVADRVFTWE